MDRRAFIRNGLIAVLIAPAATAQAQQSSKSPRIGLLIYGSKSSFADRVGGFREGMRERGYVEGQNVVFEYRYADGKLERLPDLAELLVALKVDVIVASATPAIQAAMKATKTIPIVMASSADPVQAGLVASLARPGGNVTGVSSLAPDLDGKRLQLLREIQPKLRKVGLLWDPASASALRLAAIEKAARSFGITVLSVEVRNPAELESGFEIAAKERMGAMLISSSMAAFHGRQVTEIAARKRMPMIFDTREVVTNVGGFMAYGPDSRDLYRRAATYVEKILKGAKPADLPVEQPTKFELAINLKAAKALGIAIPQSLLQRADHVVQ